MVSRVLAFIKKSAMNMLVQDFLWTYVFILLFKYLGVALLIHIVNIKLYFTG